MCGFWSRQARGWKIAFIISLIAVVMNVISLALTHNILHTVLIVIMTYITYDCYRRYKACKFFQKYEIKEV